MKKTDKITFREKSVEEVSKLLTDTQKQLVEARTKLSLGSQKDTSVVGKLKYQIAFLKTLIKEKQ